MNTILERIAHDHRTAVDGMLTANADAIVALAHRCAVAVEKGNKLLFCGNGGSACDAMHIAGEFVGRFVNDRRPLPAMALTADSGVITAIANDYRYEDIFSRQVEALGNAGDVLIALSTSGKSQNVINALTAGSAKGLTTALLTGEKGRNGPARADFIMVSPSVITAHIQESHMVVLHALASLIEAELFP